MRRRAFLRSVTAAVALTSSLALAQQTLKPARIAVISLNPQNPVGTYKGLFTGLRELGLVQGQSLFAQTVLLEQPRPALFAAVAEAARSGSQLLVATGPELALQAAVSAGGTLPIVFVAINYDPIALGYAKSLARPGGNITGVFIRQPELAEKQVELLNHAFPGRRRLGMLWDALSSDQFKAADQRAKALGLEPIPVQLDNSPYDFAAAFTSLAASGAELLVVLSSPRFTESRERIAELAIQHRLPSMFIFRTYVEAGGLMSYGYEGEKAGRRAALYVRKIIDGARPAELPIEQPTTYEFVINLKTANALSVTLPTALLARADEVIE
jgi:putative tryptophan/tyrosine transport system substrate-binding protein